MRLKIDSHADVIRYTLITTLLAVLVPVSVVAMTLWRIHATMPEIYFGSLAISALIPLLITPPIAAVGLHMMLMLTKTIERIDGHVKFDSLTGIFNRGHFLDSVRGRRVDGMVLIVDADHFKAVNDDLGHDAGDEVLKLLATKLADIVGDAGLVGRLGGEEFGVFLPEQSQDHAAAMAAKICDQIRQAFVPVGDIRLRITVSVGGAFHKESAPIGHALKIADQRLYRAKDAGRDRFVVHESEIDKARSNQKNAAAR